MVGKFAHSFDRETFHGSKDTRQDALREAFDLAVKQEDRPDTVYVGKRVPIDPGSSGLAEMILGAMRRRVREETGFDAASNQYLMRVNEHQLAELDDEIDRVVRAWLAKHGLAPTQSKIVAISEHPVPAPKMHSAIGGGGEVSDLGQSRQEITLW
jgi:hypothetical protein